MGGDPAAIAYDGAASAALAPVVTLMEGTPTPERLRQAEEELARLRPPALPAETLKAFKEYIDLTKNLAK